MQSIHDVNNRHNIYTNSRTKIFHKNIKITFIPIQKVKLLIIKSIILTSIQETVGCIIMKIIIMKKK